METQSGVFRLEGNTRFRVEHALDGQNELTIDFYGGLIDRQGQRFEQYLSHLERLQNLVEKASVKHVHCHLEHLGEALSRAQHAIYRMLHAMRSQGCAITIYATADLPEQSEHLKMSRAFVAGLSRQPGAPVEVVEVRRAS